MAWHRTKSFSLSTNCRRLNALVGRFAVSRCPGARTCEMARRLCRIRAPTVFSVLLLLMQPLPRFKRLPLHQPRSIMLVFTSPPLTAVTCRGGRRCRRESRDTARRNRPTVHNPAYRPRLCSVGVKSREFAQNHNEHIQKKKF